MSMAHVQSQTVRFSRRLLPVLNQKNPRVSDSPATPVALPQPGTAGLSSWAHAYDIQRLPLWGFQAPWTRGSSDRGTHPRTKWILNWGKPLYKCRFEWETQLYYKCVVFPCLIASGCVGHMFLGVLREKCRATCSAPLQTRLS